MAKKKAAADSAQKPESTEKLAFEPALEELEDIVSRLEQGAGPLEDALDEYAKAIQLIKVCHSRLEDAERKIEVLSGFDAEGNPVTQKLEESEEKSTTSRTARKSTKRKMDVGEGLFD